MPVTNNNFIPLQQRECCQLLELARTSIQVFLATGKELTVNSLDYPPALQQFAASFVTLRINKQLRGCIGTTKAYRPLVEDVVHNAHSAAFDDFRFPPLKAEEEPAVHLEISVLSTPRAISFSSESDLLNQLVAGEDGIILQEGVHRATFLPTVWHSLPDKKQFLNQLKLKAGLDENHWSDRIEAWRYHTITFGEKELTC